MAPNNQIADMRDILFAQLQRLTDPNCNLDKEVMRSNAINDTCAKIIDSAKVEVSYVAITGKISSDFIPACPQITDGKKPKLLKHGNTAE